MAVDPRLLRRIEDRIGIPGLVEALVTRLSSSDLNSLLLEVVRRRAGSTTPADILARHARSRFTGASPLPFGELRAIADLAHKVFRPQFRFMELSPLAPLGTCAATADVDPVWSIAALRGTEVLSDVTNALALEAALLRRVTREDVRLAAVARVVRPQHYGDATALAHFSLLGLVSSGRDRGDFRFEAEAIEDHLGGYVALVRSWFPADWEPQVTYTCPDPTDMRLAALTTIAASLGLDLSENPDREAAQGYYTGFCLNLDIVRPSGQRHQLVDLGAVRWGARLLGDAKERMIVSGTGIDRLVTLQSEATT